MKRLAPIALLALTACTDQVSQPIVTAFNGDSVEIQINNASFLSPDALKASHAAADVEAANICRRGPNKRSEFVSTRTISTPNSLIVHEARLYLCLR